MWALFFHFHFHLPFLFLSLLFPSFPATPCPPPPGAALHAEAHDEDGGGHPAQQVHVLQGHRGQGHPPSVVVLRLTTALDPQLPFKDGIPPLPLKGRERPIRRMRAGESLEKRPVSSFLAGFTSCRTNFKDIGLCRIFTSRMHVTIASIPYITASLEPCFEDICLTALTIHSSAPPLLAPVTTRVSPGAVVTSSYLGGGASAAAAAANASS